MTDDDDDVTKTRAAEDDVQELVRQLGERSAAVTPTEFAASDRSGWQLPGLYSWWVDDAGAAELAAGLGLPVAEGLVYAGLAGATHWPSGSPSRNTLWSRIVTMHLGGNVRSSTLRRSLGAVLAHARGVEAVPEPEITAWMKSHLRVHAVVYRDADTLGQREQDILRALDPPLNLQDLPSTELRTGLKRLRRTHSGATVTSRKTIPTTDEPDVRRELSGYQRMVQALDEHGLLVPFIGVARADIRCWQEWTWASRKVDPNALYDFNLDVVARGIVSGGPGFALSHSGHGVNSYALTLVTGAGPVAVVLQHGYGGVYDDSAASRRRINGDYADVGTALGSLGRADPAPAVLIAWSGLRDEGARVDLRRLRAGARATEASRRIDSRADFMAALREYQSMTTDAKPETARGTGMIDDTDDGEMYDALVVDDDPTHRSGDGPRPARGAVPVSGAATDAGAMPHGYADRVRGCLIGGAVGDALGAPVEFARLDEILAGHGPAGVRTFPPGDGIGPAGLVTDDTQMTLFTVEGIIRASVREDRGLGFTPTVIQHTYLRWLETQRNDAPAPDPNGWLAGQAWLYAQRAPGATCIAALTAAAEPGADATERNDSKGCGTVMRSAPFGLIRGVRDRDGSRRGAIYNLTVIAARYTHGHATAHVAAGAFALIIADLVDGHDLPTALDRTLDYLGGQPDADETIGALRRAKESAAAGNANPARVEALGGGWVAEESLAIAVYAALAFPGPDEVLDALSLAVTHSGDSDSTGAICGNILGAWHGQAAIPAELAFDLEGRGTILEIADDLVYEMTQRDRLHGYDIHTRWRDRYPGN